MKAVYHPANSRGDANHGWLKSQHTFSFANYYDPERMGFGALRVINDDVIDPGTGFGTHPHQNMEIISVPLSGALRHKDTMGNDFVIKSGEVQTMSAGTGVAHSEYNHSNEEKANFLQIWVLPEKQNIEPAYSQKKFEKADRKNAWQLVVSPDGREDSVSINQNAFFSQAEVKASQSLRYEKYDQNNGVYIFVIEGEVEVSGQKLETRDGLGIYEADKLEFKASADTELLLMEVPL